MTRPLFSDVWPLSALTLGLAYLGHDAQGWSLVGFAFLAAVALVITSAATRIDTSHKRRERR